MSLIKCFECKSEISSTVKACPKCGAKTKKKSVLLWLLLLVVFLIVSSVVADMLAKQRRLDALRYSYLNTDEVRSDKTVKPLPIEIKAEPIVIDVIEKPTWYTNISTDEMSGEISAYAHSPTISPNQKMSFPYQDVTSWMGVGCNSGDMWIYFGFSSTPNLSDKVIQDGYNLITTRIKWDEEIEEVELSQNWAAKFLHINFASSISKVTSSNNVMLALQWHGEAETYFNYSLHGSTSALEEIKKVCFNNS